MSLRPSHTLLLLAAVPLFAVDEPAPAPATTPSVEQRLQELDQQVRILSRKAEIAAEEADAKSKSGVSAFANDKDGFGIKSNDGLYKLRLNALLQVDGRFFLHDNNDTGKATDSPVLSNQFLIRNFRLNFIASLGPNIDAILVPNFAGQTVSIVDGYVNARYIPGADLRFGKFVGLVGQDRLQSITALDFPERSLAANLTTNRDVGAQVSGGFAKNSYGYALAIFDGAPDNADRENEGALRGKPEGDSKEGQVKLWLNPVAAFGLDDGTTSEVGVGGSFSTEEGNAATTNLTTGYVSPGQHPIFTYRTGTFADGGHTRINPYFRFYRGSFGLIGEYIATQQQVTLGTYTETYAHQAWSLQGSYVLTGENSTWGGVAPRSNLDPANGSWGAFELVGRVHQLRLDDDVFEGTATTSLANQAVSVERATAVGVGVNWYWTRNVKVSLTYDQTRFRGGAGTFASPDDRSTEHFVDTRVSLSF